MSHGMNEHNLIQVECENNSTVNEKDHIYHSFQTWSISTQIFYAYHLCWTSLSVESTAVCELAS